MVPVPVVLSVTGWKAWELYMRFRMSGSRNTIWYLVIGLFADTWEIFLCAAFRQFPMNHCQLNVWAQALLFIFYISIHIFMWELCFCILNSNFQLCLLEFAIIENTQFSLLPEAIKAGMIHTQECMLSRPNHWTAMPGLCCLQPLDTGVSMRNPYNKVLLLAQHCCA